MQTVTSSRLGVVAAIAAVVLGVGGVAFAGNALATPPGARAATATQQGDCPEDGGGYDTVRPRSGWGDDCEGDEPVHEVCPTDTVTTPDEVVLAGGHRKKPQPRETPDCPTPTETVTSPTETPTDTPTETVTPSPTSPTTTSPEPEPTPTVTPTPCDSESDDDDCGIVTEPPAFTG